jgi:hypothetical protein
MAKTYLTIEACTYSQGIPCAATIEVCMVKEYRTIEACTVREYRREARASFS